MDDMLKTRTEREAGRILKYIMGEVLGERSFPVHVIDELNEQVDLFIHTIIEAAAEKGRGQIQP